MVRFETRIDEAAAGDGNDLGVHSGDGLRCLHELIVADLPAGATIHLEVNSRDGMGNSAMQSYAMRRSRGSGGDAYPAFYYDQAANQAHFAEVHLP
jgi:hypothetical protein